MAAKRVYSDKEISTLFRRASELQRTEGSDTAGLSLPELEQIATEVGIDPANVKKAALELEEGRTWEAFHLLGAPTSIDLERIVEGELTEAKWEQAVAEFRRVFGAVGEVGELGRAREWVRADGEDELVHVTLSPAKARTRIRVLSRLWVWAVSLHVPLMGVAIAPIAMVYSMMDLGTVPETGIALAIAAAFHGIARLTFGSIGRKEDRKVRKLLADLDELISTPEVASGEHDAQQALPEAAPVDSSTEQESTARRQERALAANRTKTR